MAIECHHNEIANYISNNYQESSNYFEYLLTVMRSYNFQFIPKDFIKEEYFYLFCKFDYCFLVNLLLSTNDIDVNKKETFHIDGPYDSTPLYFAIENENIGIIKLLLKNKKTDVNIKGSDYLYGNINKRKIKKKKTHLNHTISLLLKKHGMKMIFPFLKKKLHYILLLKKKTSK